MTQPDRIVWRARQGAVSGSHGEGLASCDAVCVTQVVQLPYVVEQDEDGDWCACTLLRPGVGAVGDGTTPKEAITDLGAVLEALLEVVGPLTELTLPVNIARPLSASVIESAEA